MIDVIENFPQGHMVRLPDGVLAMVVGVAWNKPDGHASIIVETVRDGQVFVGYGTNVTGVAYRHEVIRAFEALSVHDAVFEWVITDDVMLTTVKGIVASELNVNQRITDALEAAVRRFPNVPENAFVFETSLRHLSTFLDYRALAERVRRYITEEID
jgi:hypothetical protein